MKRLTMTTNCLKLVAILMLIGVTTTGCRSRRDMPHVHAQAVEVYVPFSGSNYQTSNTHWRASGDGSSRELAMARRIAMQNARTILAGSIQATVQAVTQQYSDQRQIDDRQEFQTRLEEMSRAVVDQQLNDVRTIGERTFRQPNGNITVHIALEMGRDAVQQALNNRIAADERLRLDFDQHQFRQIFEEEMRRFENR